MRIIGCITLLLMSFVSTPWLQAEAEIDGWGDFRGIRVDGELMRFNTSLRAISADQRHMAFTATEEVKNPRWSRQGKVQTATGSILFEDGKSLSFRTTIEDTSADTARVSLQATAEDDLDLSNVLYYVNLPAADYDGASPILGNAPSATTATQPATDPASPMASASVLTAPSLRLAGANRQIEISADQPLEFTVRPDQVIDTDIVSQLGLRLPRDLSADRLVAVSFPISKGRLAKGQVAQATFNLKAGGKIDRSAVTIQVDSTKPGPAFEGVGGNFRAYGASDAESMQYNLDHLRVPWGRVPMMLSAWEPREPLTSAEAATQPSDRGNRIRQSMEVAKMLSDRHIPLILTTWDMPAWSLLPAAPPTPGRPFTIPARRLRQDKAAAVYDAMVRYIAYLKSNYGVEPRLFSINEADLGIDVMQTPEEHAEFIREVGRRLVDAGLTTRMLLADACSPHAVKFVVAAMRDPEAVKYIGGVSYHSWHDGTDAEFRAWGEAAQALKVPLFVGEAGTDSDSYRYPEIFQEPWYGMYELETNLRILRDSKPLSILHWQMTANYSILIGGGRSGQPLAPGRRFWQIKQLNATPPGAAVIPCTTSNACITTCAYVGGGHTLVHVLNGGAEREATVQGLPTDTKHVRIYLTDASHGMEELKAPEFQRGEVKLSLPADSFVSIDASAD